MKIGFIGAGNVAKKLAEAFLQKGYEVKLGARNPEKLTEWLKNIKGNVSVGNLTDAAKFGDVIFIAVDGDSINNAVETAGAENFAGKTVIDLTNPLDFSEGIPPKFTATFGNSLGEQLQRVLPNANVVKAFSSIGTEVMINPHFGVDTATMFIAGNSETAKSEASKLAAEFSWNVEDLGGIEQSFLLEALAALWVNYSLKNNSKTHAFKLLKR